MILFRDDWLKYKGVMINDETPNKSFIKISSLLKKMNIKNNTFMLQLHNKDLKGIDVFDESLSDNDKALVALECKNNFFFYIRECVRIPGGLKGDDHYILNRGNLSLFWLFFNHIQVIHKQPRQTGKSFAIQVLFSYCLNVRCTNTTITLITKDDKLRTDSSEKMKALMECLPEYLYLKTNYDKHNTQEITIKNLNNNLKAFVPSSSPRSADKIGRGITSSILNIDEAGYCNNIAILTPVALASSSAAREMAKKKNEPYGVIFTTTAVKKDDVDGKYINDLKTGSAPWTENFYDCKDLEGLKKSVVVSSRDSVQRISSSFNHRQLGYTDEWLKEALEQSLSTGEIADRDFFNIDTSGSQGSVLSVELTQLINESKVDDNFCEISEQYGYVIRWYIKEDEIPRRLSSSKFILGLDTSDAVSRDDIAIILRDVRTGEVIAAGNYNETNTINFSTWIFMAWLEKYENITLVIERKLNGGMFIDNIILLMESRNINPFKRIYNTIVQNAEDDKEKFNNINKNLSFIDKNLYVTYKKSFGFCTTGTGLHSRSNLFGKTLLESAKLTGDSVRDSRTIKQILELVIKNGRINHTNTGHDDLVVAWLLSFWLLVEGKNLHFYGIDSKELLVNNKTKSLLESNVNKYETNLDKRNIDEIECLMKEIKETKNEFILNKLEQKLFFLMDKIPERFLKTLSIDDFMNKLKDKKTKNQMANRRRRFF